MYDEEYNYLSSSWNNLELEKGKTYFLGILSYDKDEVNLKIEVQKKKKAEGIEVIPGNRKYLESTWMDHFTDWKFKIKYTDGTFSEERNLEEEDSYGYEVSISSVKKGMESRWDYRDAEAGEYTVTFKCNNLETEEYTFYQVPFEEYTGTALELDKEEKVPVNKTVYFSYQVPEGADGYYSFSCGHYTWNYRVYEGKDQEISPLMINNRENKGIYHLEASKKYLFMVSISNKDDKGALLQKAPVWNMEDPITFQREAIYLVTPSETSEYHFEAVIQSTGTIMGWGFGTDLMDAETGTYIYGKLTKGKTYLLKLSISSWAGDEVYTVTAKPIITLERIDISTNYKTDLIEYISGIDLRGRGN